MSRARDLGSSINSIVAGKNLAINGAFDIWQRGTSFSNPPATYTADRFAFANAGSLTYTISRQQFAEGDTPGAAASIGSQYYLQNATTAVASPSITDWYHRIEDVTMLSGKTITISFYARATIGTATVQLVVSQYNGTSYLDTAVNEYPTFVTGNGWRRYSTTLTLPSISRSSISGINHHTNIILRHHHSVTTFGVWGLQVELGSSATPFSRAGGDIQGELAKCQRYYQVPPTAIFLHGYNSAAAGFWWQPPVVMRAAPSAALTTTSPYWESVPYTTLGSLTNAALNNTKMTASGGTIVISGTYSPSPATSYPSLFNGSNITFSAEL
jgi:hypothetical protein